MYIYGTLLTANGNFKVLNTLAGIALAINLALNYTLIPSLKAMGAAIAAISTQGFIGITNFILALILLKLSFEKKFVARFIISMVVILLLMWLSISLNWTWWQAAALIGVGTLACMVGLKILDIEQGLLLLKSKQAEKSN
jgi:hypothetical protein